MKIGILYIGIGRYVCFWDDFYKSCEQNFIPEEEKHYYVFTDQEDKIAEDGRVEVFHQDDMGWPMNSLFRFKMFHRIEKELESNDYLFFFNSNAKIIKPITATDILPINEDFLGMCIETDSSKMGFESRPLSAAYVNRDNQPYYFSGALNGGKCEPFLKLIRACDEITDNDLRNGIMPIWHDESVINRYLTCNNVKVVFREMGKPENWKEPSNARIILRRKERILGNSWLRNYKGREHTNTWFRKLMRKIGIIK